MQFLAVVCLVALLGVLWFLYRGQNENARPDRAEMYRQLDRRAQAGEEEALYRFAELFYEEQDAQYAPLIFKWVRTLAAQKDDPAVWLLLGDLFFSGFGTDENTQEALKCYERALAADIVSGRYSNLTTDAHNYLEKQIMRLRQETAQTQRAVLHKTGGNT